MNFPAMAMTVLSVSATILTAGLCSAALDTGLVMEHGQSLDVPSDWQRVGRADKQHVVPLLFALKHKNVGRLERMFWNVATPGSGSYREFVSHSKLNEMISPRLSSVRKIQSWLRSRGVDVTSDCIWTKAREYLSCTMSAEVAENLLGVEFYTFVQQSSNEVITRARQHYTVPSDVHPHLDLIGGVHRFPQSGKVTLSTSAKGLQATPRSLRSRYNVGSTVGGKSSQTIQSVGSFLRQHYSKADLKEFFVLFGEGYTHRKDIEKVIGPNTFPSGVEANLDVQYIMSMGANITTWFWSTAGSHDKQEPFLQWMMDIANTTVIPQVMSVSYGDDESSLSADYMQRVNEEFMKQGLRGMSILFASGDSGANCQGEKLVPDFPASSPYVTCVGGTSASISSGEVAAGLSSGGFSNVFSQPEYQISGITHYLSNSSRLPKGSFNRTGRGFPDVAAMATGFLVVDALIPMPVDGTSCATPTFSGVVALINDQLFLHGKKQLGFLNPFLYKNAAALNDISRDCSGSGCGGIGWCAAPGWDAATGLGTPDFEKLVKAALAE